MNTPNPKRRWFQLSLRTLLAFVMLCAIPCSLAALKKTQAKRQREAVEAVTKLGGFVTYDFMLDESGQQLSNPQPLGPAWLRDALGTDFFDTVVRVNLDATDVTDNDLQALRGLPQLRWVNLFGTNVTDAGLDYLRDVPKLERLELGGAANVTDDGVEKFQQAFPNCRIFH